MDPYKRFKKNRVPELAVCVSTYRTLEMTDISHFDAVYLGDPYCLESAENLLTHHQNLRLSMQLLRKQDKKIYLTSPVIPWGKDFSLVERLLEVASEEKADGIEIHDMGVFRLVRQNFPDLRVHLGHFANIYNKEAAQEFIDMGVVRIIPSCELTLAEIKPFFELNNLELEIPIHGQLPLGISSTCLLRLKFPERETMPCTQQCASEQYLSFGDWQMCCLGKVMVTAGDFSLIEFLPELLQNGYAAFRLSTIKDPPEKISKVGQIFRKTINEICSGKIPSCDRRVEELRMLSGKGLCNGWAWGQAGRKYIGLTETSIETRPT